MDRSFTCELNEAKAKTANYVLNLEMSYHIDFILFCSKIFSLIKGYLLLGDVVIEFRKDSNIKKTVTTTKREINNKKHVSVTEY